MAEPVSSYVITPHAGFEMARRRIDEAIVRAVQSRIEVAGKTYLVRVFVDIDRDPAEVVTVYLTSRLAKYWR